MDIVNPLVQHRFTSNKLHKTNCMHCGLSEIATVHISEEKEKEYRRQMQPLEYDPLPSDLGTLQSGGLPSAGVDQILIRQKLSEMSQKPEKLQFKSGTTATKQTRLSLIPHRGLVNAALRFEVGIQIHGKQAWNALSDNQAALSDQEWLIERCSHAIEHLYSLLDYLTSKQGDLNSGLVDAGSVAWCGLVLGEALSHRKEQNEKRP